MTVFSEIDTPLLPEVFAEDGAAGAVRRHALTAHMAARVSPPSDADHYRTPPWATRALCEFLRGFLLEDLATLDVRDPACGRCDMARPLGEFFRSVEASDLHDYGAGAVADYLTAPLTEIDGTICNTPFGGRELPFWDRAMRSSRVLVALFWPSRYTEGVRRYQCAFADNPPTVILHFAERVPLRKDTLLRKAKTKTAYSWFLWVKDIPPALGQRVAWIPPARDHLERWGDYDDDQGAAPPPRRCRHPRPNLSGMGRSLRATVEAARQKPSWLIPPRVGTGPINLLPSPLEFQATDRSELSPTLGMPQ